MNMNIEKWRKELEEIAWDAVMLKIQNEHEIQEIQIKRIFPYLTEPYLDKFFEWEKNFQEKQYQRGVDTCSYLFFILTLALIPLKISHIIDEDFMEEHFTYLNYTFKLYNGQGSFWKVYKNEIQIL